jgi:DNA polymerase-4
MNSSRKIIHFDLDAFYCAVEEQDQPELRGKPFAVGGRPEERGVVASCSYAARSYGVHSAMPMGRALRICPGLQVVGGNHARYHEVSRKVMDRLKMITPKVEQLSIDEAFLDVTDLQEPVEEIAHRLQSEIRNQMDLPCSLGVASNKLVAKIANDFGKSRAGKGTPPNALTVVPEGEETAFLAPLPVRALWGVGPKTEARLHQLDIRTIGELAQSDAAILEELFGKHGRDMARRAQGIDESKVIVERQAKSFSQEITFSRNVRTGKHLRAEITKQSISLERTLQRRDLSATTVKIKVRWPDFTTLTRQTTLVAPTDEADVIGAAARQLLESVWQEGKPVRLIGVGVSGLGEWPRQLTLWDLQERA